MAIIEELEGLIFDANEQGWLVGSLCQLAISDWYACMIDDAGFTHTATASNIYDAISIAMHNPPGRRVWSRIEGVYEDASEQRIDLVALGLVKKKPQLDRRF